MMSAVFFKRIFSGICLLTALLLSAGENAELSRLRNENRHLRQELDRLHKELASRDNDILKFRLWLASSVDSGKLQTASDRELQLTEILKEFVARSNRLLGHISGVDKKIRELLKELPISPARQARMLLQLEQMERLSLNLSAIAGVYEESGDRSALENIRVVAVDRNLETAVLSVGSVHGVFPGLLCQSKQKNGLLLRVISVRPWVCAAVPVRGSIAQVSPGMELTFAHRALPGEGIRPLHTR